MIKSYLREFLNFFWLRPENAIYNTLGARAYRSSVNDFFIKSEGSVDVSCGDGVFSFIAFGGKLTKETDMFRALDLSQERKGNFDAFDSFSQDYLVGVEEYPEKNYEFGTDLKKNLLSRAAKLNWYSKLLRHDNNHALPFEAGSMNYVYSNATYFIPDFKKHLEDLVRIAETGGHIVLEIKTNDIFKYTSKNYLPFMGERFHEIINAGRIATWKGLKSRDELVSLVEALPQTRIVRFEPVFGDMIAHIWDIGLRPVFRPLANMANKLSLEDRVKIKREWNEVFESLMLEFLESYQPKWETAIEYIMVLEKTN